MSRRYVKGSKIAFEFYGPRSPFHDACLDEYDYRLQCGMAPELARGCMPVETMTKFWVAGYERDWKEFVRLRSDAHAQAEIRVFAEAIKQMIEQGESK
jgi:thymidylate synthase (FAD)